MHYYGIYTRGTRSAEYLNLHADFLDSSRHSVKLRQRARFVSILCRMTDYDDHIHSMAYDVCGYIMQDHFLHMHFAIPCLWRNDRLAFRGGRKTAG